MADTHEHHDHHDHDHDHHDHDHHNHDHHHGKTHEQEYANPVVTLDEHAAKASGNQTRKEGKSWKRLLRSRTMRLSTMLGLTASFFFVELIVGHHLHAMSLIADSFHMLSDVLAITIGVVAIRISKRPSSTHFTFGWKRAEVIGALVNSVFLCALCFSLIIETIQRFVEPHKIKEPLLMLYVGGAGLAVNIIGLILLHVGGDVHVHAHSHGHGHGHGHDHSHGHDHEHEHEHGHGHGHDHGGHSHKHKHGHSGDDFEHNHKVGSHSNNEASVPAVQMSTGETHSLLTCGENASETTEYTAEKVSAPTVVIHMSMPDAQKLVNIVEPPADTQAGSKKKKAAATGGHNMRAVFMHVLGDALGSVIVIISAIIVWQVQQEWTVYIDPALSIVIVSIILTGTIPILRDTLRILLETVPRHIEIDKLRNALMAVPGVLAIHEFHVWQLQSDVVIASVHVSCASLSDYQRISQSVKQLFHDFNIHSTTVQPEFSSHHLSHVDFDQQTSLEATSGGELPGELAATTNNQLVVLDHSPNAQFPCTFLCGTDGVCHAQTCCPPARASLPAIANGVDADADATHNANRQSHTHGEKHRMSNKAQNDENIADTSVPPPNSAATRTPKHTDTTTQSRRSEPSKIL